MRLKPRGDTKRDGRFGNAAEPFSGHADFCAGDFRGVWIFEPAAAAGASEICFVVAVFVFAGGHWDWVGDVSGIAVRVWEKGGREISAVGHAEGTAPASMKMERNAVAGMCRAYGAHAATGHAHPGLPAWAKFCRRLRR